MQQITDTFVRDRAIQDLLEAGGHERSSSAVFSDLEVYVKRDFEDGVTIFCVEGSATVTYPRKEYRLVNEDTLEHELVEWEDTEQEDYELYYHIQDNQLIPGELQ